MKKHTKSFSPAAHATLFQCRPKGRIWGQVFVVLLLLAQPGLSAATARAASPSARPLPRFATLKSSEARLRTGPGKEYPILWTITFPGLPLKIISEYQHWRHVLLHDGTKGWIHQSLLSAHRRVLVLEDKTYLYDRDDIKRHPVAVLQKNLLIPFKKTKCRNGYCYFDVQDYHGWINAERLWGLLDQD